MSSIFSTHKITSEPFSIFIKPITLLIFFKFFIFLNFSKNMMGILFFNLFHLFSFPKWKFFYISPSAPKRYQQLFEVYSLHIQIVMQPVNKRSKLQDITKNTISITQASTILNQVEKWENKINQCYNYKLKKPSYASDYLC